MPYNYSLNYAIQSIFPMCQNINTCTAHDKTVHTTQSWHDTTDYRRNTMRKPSLSLWFTLVLAKGEPLAIAQASL